MTRRLGTWLQNSNRLMGIKERWYLWCNHHGSLSLVVRNGNTSDTLHMYTLRTEDQQADRKRCIKLHSHDNLNNWEQNHILSLLHWLYNPIKRVIDRKRRTCRNNNRLHTQPFWTPLEISLYDVFKSVPDLCFIGLFVVLGKANYHYWPLHASRKMSSWI